MRIPLVLLAALATTLLAGCSSGPAQDPALVECDGAFHPVTLYLGPDHALMDEKPETGGAIAGNSFAGAFLTNTLDEWLSSSIAEPLHLEGNVSLTLFVEFRGSPAPIVQTGGDPQQGYQFFNQFGSDRTLQPGYATQYDTAIQAPGTQTRYNQTIELPPGGFELESGDRVRLLLTSLALDDGPDGSGHDILYGNPTPSRLEFQARCTTGHDWTFLDQRVHDVSILGNQGLFTGLLGQPELADQTTATFPLQLRADTERLTVDLVQTSDPVPVKDDIDLELVDAAGNALWSIGSPYSDEHGVLWAENLAWLRENGVSAVRVNSYSGLLYGGTLTLTQEAAAVPAA